ncbi:PepSY domain-containing protein [Glycomyces harbinensis]|uniref:Peptidase propeptide and YPEB domain-containing protein n=1 Tax=Glycomyces harbinensis TaxID=58114 RepID=A0A1G7BQ89_9ACTN|nr:PepSY domain-containing protein [Glycomyces harbinensis]SDE29137.1 Peptidase propeptide and YPEB domain-containing protein [Glycomyces harbinensis]
MNTPNDTQQPEAPKARRFAGRHRTLIIAGTAGALLLGGGAAAAFAADADETRTDATGTTDDRRGQTGTEDADDVYDTDADDFALPAEAIGEDAAVEAALAEVAGDVHDTDLEGTVDAPVWVVEVVDADNAEWDVVVNALDGSIADVFADDDDNDADDADDDLDDDDQDDNDRDDDDDQDGDDD